MDVDEATPPSSPGREDHSFPVVISVSEDVKKYIDSAIWQYRYIMDKFTTRGEFIIFLQLLSWEAKETTGMARNMFIDYCIQECVAGRSFKRYSHLFWEKDRRQE